MVKLYESLPRIKHFEWGKREMVTPITMLHNAVRTTELQKLYAIEGNKILLLIPN